MTPRLKIKLTKDAVFCTITYAVALLSWSVYNVLAYGRFDIGAMWAVFGIGAGLLYGVLWRLRIDEENDLKRRRIRKIGAAEDEWKD